MDAVKFLQERNRMYESGAATPDIGLENDYDIASAVQIVEKWSAAHPRKTRQSVFLEQWPEARVESDGISSICPAVLSKAYRMYSGEKCPNTITPKICADCRREFWMQEVE